MLGAIRNRCNAIKTYGDESEGWWVAVRDMEARTFQCAPYSDALSRCAMAEHYCGSKHVAEAFAEFVGVAAKKKAA